MSGSDRASELAARFEAAHGEVLAFAGGCSEQAWAALTEAEGWPVGVVLGHIAAGYGAFGRWMAGYAEGRPVTETREAVDAENARQAAAPPPPREETMARLRERARETSAVIRGLSDDLLATSLPMALAGGAEISAERLVELLLRHTGRHLESCRAAVA